VIKAVLLLGLLSLSSTVLAAEPAAPAAATAPSRARVLVLTPTSKVFDAGTTTTIGGLVTSELAGDTRLDIIASDDVERLAALEGDRQNVGCTDNSCLAELAGAIGARYVVFGDVGRLGDVVIVQLNLFDSQTAQALTRVTVQANSMSELPRALQPRVHELAAPLLSSTTTSAAAASRSFNALPWVFIGVGAAAIVGGGAIEFTSDVADNGAYDLQDFASPVLWVVGGAGVIAGVVMLVTGASNAP
jgi:hypothetical protein